MFKGVDMNTNKSNRLKKRKSSDWMNYHNPLGFGQPFNTTNRLNHTDSIFNPSKPQWVVLKPVAVIYIINRELKSKNLTHILTKVRLKHNQ